MGGPRRFAFYAGTQISEERLKIYSLQKVKESLERFQLRQSVSSKPPSLARRDRDRLMLDM
jgi:hypothetical protein